MNNPFDQFDNQEANPFDQFDAEQPQADDPYPDVPRIDAQGNTINDDGPAPVEPERTMGDVAQGIYETVYNTGAGALGSPFYIKDAIQGAIRSLVDKGYSGEDAAKFAEESASRFMMQPESETGKDIAKFMGEVLGSLPPVAAGIPAVPKYNAPVRAISEEIKQDVKQSMTPRPEPMNSVGAAEVEQARLRQEMANELPVPIKLTKGQATQDMQQQKFERETAKLEDGEELRRNANLQNEQFNQNLDAMIDQTGTTLPDDALVETGLAVTKALENQVKAEKSKINRAYDAADKSEGAQEPVNLDQVSSYMNERMPESDSGGIMPKFQLKTKQLGLSEGDFLNGDYQLSDMTVYEAELLRKFLNKNANKSDANDLRLASGLKNSIDSSVGEAGGETYNRARKLRRNYAKKYQEKKLINDLVSTKPNSSDRKIALENVFQKSVKTGSADELKNLRRTLQRTDEGKQAYAELAAQAIKNVKKQATGNIGQDENGNPLVSPAKLNKEIKSLDESGKLEILFGKKGAEDLRTIADVSRDVLVSQPGAVNTSNTASTLLTQMMDAAILPVSFYATGLPLYGLTAGARQIKDKARKRKTKKQIDQALNFDTGANE